ncbi:ultraviolet N-glycosylase/AP lyase [Andreesenia angusta]|uniref:Endonuclease III n=2 Tax=Andreesenia angusta TaxID=39480 RepID=A0A1S1V6I1_9FIRM|nr:ultraviolet N-glycosylase/AP lyase [Andreesenia angusta]
MMDKKQVKKVLEILHQNYPDAECELNYSTPFELMVATILSAQCTDVRVNKVTAELFKEYNKPEDYLSLSESELGEKIRSTGFYRNKSRHILESARILYNEYGSELPQTREELMKLPGVGRKTANVILSNAFKKNAIAVDTHVFRVSNRIGIVNESDVFKTELSLMEQIDESSWSLSHNLLVLHGRRVCKARNPLCEECDVKKYCLYYNGTV